MFKNNQIDSLLRLFEERALADETTAIRERLKIFEVNQIFWDMFLSQFSAFYLLAYWSFWKTQNS